MASRYEASKYLKSITTNDSQWIIILEGVFTILFSLFAIWVLPNTPLDVKTLSPSARAYCQQRLELDAKGSESSEIIPKDILGAIKDISLWILVLILFCNGISLFGLAYFTPSIVTGFGYSTNKTQLYTVPPFAMAFVVTVIAALVSDKYKARGAVAFVATSLSMASFAVFYTSKTVVVRYVSLHMLITGVCATVLCLIAWLSNNSAAHTRRATAVAMGFMATNLGGIVSPWLYPKSAAPKYKFAAKFDLALNCIMLVGILVNVLVLRWRNRVKVEKREEILAGLEELDDKEQYELLGDRHPDFKYTL
jgi:predicted MFS family arabinose efflux permease